MVVFTGALSFSHTERGACKKLPSFKKKEVGGIESFNLVLGGGGTKGIGPASFNTVP